MRAAVRMRTLCSLLAMIFPRGADEETETEEMTLFTQFLNSSGRLLLKRWTEPGRHVSWWCEEACGWVVRMQTAAGMQLGMQPEEAITGLEMFRSVLCCSGVGVSAPSWKELWKTGYMGVGCGRVGSAGARSFVLLSLDLASHKTLTRLDHRYSRVGTCMSRQGDGP